MTLHGGGRQVRRVRVRLWREAGGLCQRCGEGIDLGASPLAPDGLTIGHLIPVAAGGSDAWANLGPEHRRCNLAAGDRLDVSPPARVAVGFFGTGTPRGRSTGPRNGAQSGIVARGRN